MIKISLFPKSFVGIQYATSFIGIKASTRLEEIDLIDIQLYNRGRQYMVRTNILLRDYYVESSIPAG